MDSVKDAPRESVVTISIRWLRRHYDWSAYLYLIPGLIFYVLFLLRPMVESAWISLFDWDGIASSTWVGVQNYRDILTDGSIWGSFWHSLVFIFFYAVLPIVLALCVIMIISRFTVKGLSLFRALLFVPYVLSTVVVAISWRWILGESGPINTVLRAVGLDFLAHSWLGDFATALPSVGIIGTWVMFGLAFVLFISGLQNIPRELYEAARIDGAGAWREFFTVTLPGLRGEIQVALILLVTAALRNFDIVWNTTSGGPGTSTTVPSYFIYREAFMTHRVGRASAIAVVLTVIIFVIVGVVTRLTSEKPDIPDTRRTKLRRAAKGGVVR